MAAPGPVSLSKVPPLTEREREILRWVAAGLQNKEIAQKLGISLATVRNHIHNILEKLDVHSKLEAVSLAFRQGWVSGPNGELGLSAEPATRRSRRSASPEPAPQAMPPAGPTRCCAPSTSPRRPSSSSGRRPSRARSPAATAGPPPSPAATRAS